MKRLTCLKLSTVARLTGFCLGLLFSLSAHAWSGSDYVKRFMNYLQWSEQLPDTTDTAFIQFISEDTPLARKLRGKWLYQLASQKDWINYGRYYQNSTDISLQCYALVANYQSGNIQAATSGIIPLWLTGESQPPACNQLFDIMLKNNAISEQLISKRIQLALEKRNLGLAQYLLKQYPKPRLGDIKLLQSIYQNPKAISSLSKGDLQGDFYLYGLKRLVSINIDLALRFWKNPLTKKLLNEPQQQAFMAHVALYKAIRNHPDTQAWFAKIKPQYSNETVLDWEIRAALKQQNWKVVQRLIERSSNKDSPAWQYWLARAKEALGQRDAAKLMYQTLAQTRSYYGFLASLHVNQSFSFQNEKPSKSAKLIQPYKPVLSMIKSFYTSKQILQASRLLNDFVSELPKEDQSAVVYWVETELQWHGKTVYLSNNEILNNQLDLRFPLAHQQNVSKLAKTYQVPPEFIFAIIRQESCFREDATSSAGARGLMQLMPQTAKMVAKNEKIAYSDKEQLFSSQKNINLGVAYLKQLGKRYAQHPILIAAAYNAGPRQVNFWLKTHPPKQIDIWIETLPWLETRNYLKNVMAFYAVYQYRLQQKPDLRAFLQPF